MGQQDRQRLDEFDLLAYADGLLEGDPARKAQVEEALRASPEDALRIRAYQAQTEALRRRYGRRIEDAVPERLYAVLDRGRDRRLRYVAQAAAVVALIVFAGASGWLAGQWNRSGGWSAKAFVEQSYLNYVESASDSSAAPTAASAGSGKAMNWLSNKVSLTIRAPDLRERGFSIMEKQTVAVADSQMVRLTYASQDGRSFSLFLRPRWENEGPEVKVTKEGDVSLAYWLDGPLASAIASRLSRQETLEIAKIVRRAMKDPQRSEPAVHATPAEPSPEGTALATGGPTYEIPVYPEKSPASLSGPNEAEGVITTN